MTRPSCRMPIGRLILTLVCVIAATLSLSPASLRADEAAQGKGVVENEELFKIPDGGAAKIQEFMKNLAQTAPEGESEEDQMAFSVRALNTLVEAADRLLAAKPSADQAAQAFAYKIEALQALTAMDQADAGKKLEEVLATAREDKREPIVGLGWQNTIMYAISRWSNLDPKERDAFIKLIVDKVKAGPKPIDVSIVQVTSMQLDGADDKAVASLLEQVIPLFEKSDDKDLHSKLTEANLPGMYRRLTLLGKPMKIEGTLLDGKPVDWESYRGKVVLVDFWATWCGPCRAEIPNVLEMYEAYHDQGFDVLGVSLDDTAAAAEKYVAENKLPWSSIFPKNEDQRGWSNPLVGYYGITGIPTAILVGKDGNVVNMNARGPVLGEQLEKLLGPPAEKKTEEAAAK
ncbi:TlpA family protein disulfide reductase [Lacipirellula limnantheis]|uniref:Thiol-disulfide oxidoreductase ResA n=1 Tax=Lacipirellula limnantheis TaxID=2528024 RepID=A0A517TST0_9BACT|nr:TlpA disulfide reductase family protein [Lacipirellula limnantheis]QDT71412.1 Thiol-disulfide oxidoreductase ResA [Lacipirellula limnantheis]